MKHADLMPDDHTGRRTPWWAKPFRVRAVIFDFDGTLTRPGALDFVSIKRAIGCPPEEQVLEFVESLRDPERRANALRALERFEEEAADCSEPNAGAAQALAFLRHHDVKVGIVSRNGTASIQRALGRLREAGVPVIDVIVSRDFRGRPKPAPDGILHAAAQLGVRPAETIFVGDHPLDVVAGRSAGVMTAFLTNGADLPTAATEADVVIADLQQLVGIVRLGLPLRPGKLPRDVLETYLAGLPMSDPSVLVRAGIGEDAAAVLVGDDDVLTLASDPITLASDALSLYAVMANANDVATCGADPRWFLATLLFPAGSTGSEILSVMEGLADMCGRAGIALCGGHTEITETVLRPVVVGMIAGTVSRDRLIDKRRMCEDDLLILTKQIAVEGTGLIAREIPSRLRALGMSPAEIERSAGFLEHIGIVSEARIAARTSGVSAMHDVTEGGLATAVEELSAAGRHRIRVHVDRVPIFPETARICTALGLDPFGLIASGSLLVTCAPATCGDLLAALGSAGIEARVIGEVLGAGEGVEAWRAGSRAAWPRFERDEVTRITE